MNAIALWSILAISGCCILFILGCFWFSNRQEKERMAITKEVKDYAENQERERELSARIWADWIEEQQNVKKIKRRTS